jgi:hypothetical protein
MFENNKEIRKRKSEGRRKVLKFQKRKENKKFDR